MDEGDPLLCVIIFVAFLILDAIFYGFGAAIQNVNSMELEHQLEEGNKKAGRLLHIVNRPAGFVNTIQITTTLIGMGTGVFVSQSFNRSLFRFFAEREIPVGPGLSLLVRVFCCALLVVILVAFGMMIPKRCAARRPEQWGYGLLPAVSLIMAPFLPVAWLANGLVFVVLKIFGIEMDSGYEKVTEEDIMSMVNEGHEQGILEAREAEMITNIFRLNDKEAGDIMTHRKNLAALDGDITLKEAVDFILKEGYNSRYPVYQKDVDDIIGILHMKDALAALQNRRNASRRLWEVSGLLREAHFIPETRNIDTLFKEMQSGKIHMVIVVDEYGQTAGIVTMEDILEEIVGDILDEYDMDQEYVVREEDGSFRINGMTPLEEAAKALNIEFDEEDYDSYDTVNGMLVSKLDRIPQEGEQTEVSVCGYVFKILQVENKIIRTVGVWKEEPGELEETSKEDGMAAGEAAAGEPEEVS